MTSTREPAPRAPEQGAEQRHAPHELAAALGADGAEVIFTSGATEAINLAIMGYGLPVAAAATEHAAVLDVVEFLGGQTFPVDIAGLIRPVAQASGSVGGQALTAIMLVNNEIGTIQPIAELAGAAHAKGSLFLCDAVQAFGRMPIPDGPDMIAISAHKIHGPKGIGALWVRDGIALTGYSATQILVNSGVDSQAQTISGQSCWRGICDASSAGIWVLDQGEFRLERYLVDPTYDGEVNPISIVDATVPQPVALDVVDLPALPNVLD